MKRIIVTILISATLLTTGCVSNGQDEDNKVKNCYSTEDYQSVFNTYGITYKVPSSWTEAKDNSNEASYYYKNGIGNGDGMLYVCYTPNVKNLFSGNNVNEYIDGISESAIGSVESSKVAINEIPMLDLSYDQKIGASTYACESVAFNKGNGLFTVALSSKKEGEYAEEWSEILNSINFRSLPEMAESDKKSTVDSSAKKSRNIQTSKGDKYNIEKCDIIFAGEYRNDTTGKWRLAETSSNIEIQKYALSYYRKYFKSKDEIHIVVNFANKTTTKISNMGGILDVSIHDYVKGEEHDAKSALSGTLLNEYHVNMKSGTIDKI